ncbi:hypothetical protein [uncultured Rhodoblastus sp.]|uniref:hypothetical protein n=1 Tax=uncultured Rhodoblastus sp. TaxID=543037 RepID=UPI0025DB555B|nr:hypothetical protein [uncultured Rhodoblastus sp.]
MLHRVFPVYTTIALAKLAIHGASSFFRVTSNLVLPQPLLKTAAFFVFGLVRFFRTFQSGFSAGGWVVAEATTRL